MITTPQQINPRLPQGNKRNFGALLSSILFVSLMAYFVYHLFQGERGIFSMLSLQKKLKIEEEKLDELQVKREILERQVTLLRPDSLDLDMLEERVRAVLHFAQPDEIIINDTPQQPSPVAKAN